ncbi:MAG: YjbH domain-containing protein [Pseudorhodobacter sp.]|nr:YjbH domain-containing protein [Pseudorhodobacter sp.]
MALLASGELHGETWPSLNFYGVTGLIDMPSGEAQPDAHLTVSSAHFGPVSRTTLSFQITPRLSGSFRYMGVRDWNKAIGGTDPGYTYYDRSFDLRYQVLKEGRYVPAVSVGLQDFIGTSLLSGEYIAATKHLTPTLKFTAGLGWGRLGSYGSIGSPFGDRPPIDFGLGGTVDFGQWFRGPVAPFGGVEWQVNPKWAVKAEYSSDAYDLESTARQTFNRKSPFNFGVEYQAYDTLRLGAYYMYGSEIGFAAHIAMNPQQRPMGGMMDPAPDPVKPRPSRASDQDAWSPEWITQDGAGPVLIDNLNRRLKSDGIIVEALGYTGSTAQIRIRNTRYDAEAQAVGRVARAMTQIMPASVEVFEIVPVVKGIPAAKVTLQRSDLEALEFAPGAAEAIRARTTIGEAGPKMAGLTYDTKLYPRLNWSVGPYVRTSLFDPEAPVRADLGLRFDGEYQLAPGLFANLAIAKKVVGTLDQSTRVSDSVLPHVRSDSNRYDAAEGATIDRLTMAWYTHPFNRIYGRLTVGYLERMFGGVSTELLWKPVNGPLALGVEVNYARQRDFNQQFGFQNYDVLTGHASAYYQFADKYFAQLDVGRYLAGDVGATLTLDRVFANGWRVGAFATLTDVPFSDFGEGSFDKGIRIQVPFAWALGQPTRRSSIAIIRPIGRDGGARLDVEGRLYDTVRDYDASSLDDQWGRFWK